MPKSTDKLVSAPVAEAVADPQVAHMEAEFATEEMSTDVLDTKDRDRGGQFASEGGTVTVVPSGYVDEMRKGRKQRVALGNFPSRPSSVSLFNWNGVPSEVPIAYQPGGSNPSISLYLRKKHCNSCQANGFILTFCPTCGSQDVIRFYYSKYEDVPVKTNWYGDILCLCSQFGEMQGSCPRDGRERDGQKTGFLSEQQMLMHASSKHPREYGIWATLRQTAPLAPQVDTDKLRAEILAEVMEQMTAPDNDKESAEAS
tara:strand:+ start:769 stop:1539 length:771 start_codon:yes stop_codon:yes gene_type:complete